MRGEAGKNICVFALILLMGLAALILQGCGSKTNSEPDEETEAVEDAVSGTELSENEAYESEPWTEDEEPVEMSNTGSGIGMETATDGLIDFEALTEQNPDIYAWLYIPDTDIDCPLVRANNSDDWYVTHGADGQTDIHGAVYTQIYNSPDFSDFNTVIHGKAVTEDDPLYGIHDFEVPDFFDTHTTMYIITPYTTITYEIIAAYPDTGTDIIRRYDYTTYIGCNRWITDYMSYKELSMNRIDPTVPLSVDTSFIVTITDSVTSDASDSEKQYVLIASMLNSGTLELTRYVSDEDDYYENIDISGE